MAAAAAEGAFEGDEEAACGLLLLGLLLVLFLLGLLELLLQLCHGWAVEDAAAIGDATVLEGATVELWAVVVVALSDDFTAAHDDAAVTIVQGRLVGLLEAKSEVLIGLHVDCWSRQVEYHEL